MISQDMNWIEHTDCVLCGFRYIREFNPWSWLIRLKLKVEVLDKDYIRKHWNKYNIIKTLFTLENCTFSQENTRDSRIY